MNVGKCDTYEIIWIVAEFDQYSILPAKVKYDFTQHWELISNFNLREIVRLMYKEEDKLRKIWFVISYFWFCVGVKDDIIFSKYFTWKLKIYSVMWSLIVD